MSSSIFGAEQRNSEPLSALAVLTGRHGEKNTRDPVLINSQSKDNERTKSTSQRYRATGLLYYVTPALKINLIQGYMRFFTSSPTVFYDDKAVSRRSTNMSPRQVRA